MPRSPRHIRPTAALAPRALLPGDPGRALLLAQELTDEPRMFNHNRGLWGYTGAAPDGRPVTIMSHGMGGPSAAIVLEELCDLGLELAIRVGTCGALDERLALGSVVAVTEALPGDGTSAALGARGPLAADARLTERLGAAADHAGVVASTDLFYDPDPARVEGWRAAGAIAVEMEAATVLAVAARRGVRAACLLAVSDSLPGAGQRIAADLLEAAALRTGRAALAALMAETT